MSLTVTKSSAQCRNFMSSEFWMLSAWNSMSSFLTFEGFEWSEWWILCNSKSMKLISCLIEHPWFRDNRWDELFSSRLLSFVNESSSLCEFDFLSSIDPSFFKAREFWFSSIRFAKSRLGSDLLDLTLFCFNAQFFMLNWIWRSS